MFNFSDEAVRRLKNGNITRAYLKVLATDTEEEFIINESNYLKDLEFTDERYVENEGFIGQTVAKEVSGNFNNVDQAFSIQDREMELYFGVDLENGTTEYRKYGTFIVQKPTDDTVGDNTHFQALDYMVKFNDEYIDEMVYPCTIKDIFQKVVTKKGMQYTSDHFLNENFVVKNNPFPEGTTNREVLKAIGQVAFSWVRITEDNKVAIDFNKDISVSETINTDMYFDFSKQDDYGEVNTVVLKISDVEGENATVKDFDSIQKYGATEISIVDNPFAITEDDRFDLVEAGRNLFGLKYTPCELKTIGLIYLNCLNRIKLIDLKGNEYITYIFNHTISYSGTLTDSIKTSAMTKTETLYQYTSPERNKLTQTEIRVNKSENKINLLSSEVGEMDEKVAEMEITVDKINSKVSDISDLTRTVSGTKKVTISDAFGGENVVELHIYGNNTVFDQLYPQSNLYPSNTLYPWGDSRIKVHNSKGDQIRELGVTEVLRMNAETRDEVVINDTQVMLIRRINKDGTTKTREEKSILGTVDLILEEGDNTIEIINYSAPIEVKYAIKSVYTNIFATKVQTSSEIEQTANSIKLDVNTKLNDYSTTTEMNSAIKLEADSITSSVASTYETKSDVDTKISGAKSEIKQTTDSITTEVNKKVGNNEVISKINQSAEQVKINANKFSFQRKRN